MKSVMDDEPSLNHHDSLLEDVDGKDADEVGDEDEEKELLCSLLLVNIQIHHHRLLPVPTENCNKLR